MADATTVTEVPKTIFSLYFETQVFQSLSSVKSRYGIKFFHDGLYIRQQDRFSMVVGSDLNNFTDHSSEVFQHLMKVVNGEDFPIEINGYIHAIPGKDFTCDKDVQDEGSDVLRFITSGAMKIFIEDYEVTLKDPMISPPIRHMAFGDDFKVRKVYYSYFKGFVTARLCKPIEPLPEESVKRRFSKTKKIRVGKINDVFLLMPNINLLSLKAGNQFGAISASYCKMEETDETFADIMFWLRNHTMAYPRNIGLLYCAIKDLDSSIFNPSDLYPTFKKTINPETINKVITKMISLDKETEMIMRCSQKLMDDYEKYLNNGKKKSKSEETISYFVALTVNNQIELHPLEVKTIIAKLSNSEESSSIFAIIDKRISSVDVLDEGEEED